MSKSQHALHRIALVLATALMAACSQSQVESSATSTSARDRASGGHDIVSFTGLPDGRTEVGDRLAHTKRKTTGQSCIDCHGADGNAPIDPTYPKLGGQYGDYLAHALLAYRSADRQHPLMTLQAANLSDQDITDLAAYFGSRPPQLRDLQGVK